MILDYSIFSFSYIWSTILDFMIFTKRQKTTTTGSKIVKTNKGDLKVKVKPGKYKIWKKCLSKYDCCGNIKFLEQRHVFPNCFQINFSKSPNLQFIASKLVDGYKRSNLVWASKASSAVYRSKTTNYKLQLCSLFRTSQQKFTCTSMASLLIEIPTN